MNKKIALAVASLFILPGLVNGQGGLGPHVTKDVQSIAEKTPARPSELPADFLGGWYRSPDLCASDADLTLALQDGKLTVSEKNAFASERVDVTPSEEGYLLKGWGKSGEERTDLNLRLQLTPEKILIAAGLPSGGGDTMAVLVKCDQAAEKPQAPAAKEAESAKDKSAATNKPTAPAPTVRGK